MIKKEIQTKHLTEEEVIEAFKDFDGNKRFAAWSYLCTKYPGKVVNARFLKMVEKGILDYGVSLRTAWMNGDHHYKKIDNR